VLAEPPERKAQVIDLMDALRQSLGASRRRPTRDAAPARRESAKAAPATAESAAEAGHAERGAVRKPPARMTTEREGAATARRGRAK
jgi:hypothetical protein